MNLIFKLLLIFGLSFGANYLQPNLQSNSFGNLNIPDTLRLVGIMVQFPLEYPDNPKTSGEGNFLNLASEEYNHFYDSTTPRCEGFIVDRPPHDSLYFQKQLEAVGNYYHNISDGKLPYTANIITNSTQNGYFTVSKEMEYYAKGDALLAAFFSEALDSAKSDIETNYGSTFSPDSIVFVIFHAGLSQDFSYPSFDPTIYDLKSAYIDEKMMQGITPTVISGTPVFNGILLPETQNIIYYNVVEDIFGNPDYDTYDLCDIQIGLTGIFAFLLGYELGLPEMFNPKTGDPGIGYFGLMDHGSNNGRGVIPAPPTPWTRIKAEWSSKIVINPYDGPDTIIIPALDLANQVYQIKIAEDEYFLLENRNNWIEFETNIDTLRDRHKIYNLQSGDSLNGHWFDSITNEKENFIKDNSIKIDHETQIITGFDHYDYGLPGSGLLIWHIKDNDPSTYDDGINNDLENRYVQLEEADGAQDIGKESLFPTWLFDPSIGTPLDFWFLGNKEYEKLNPWKDKMLFDNSSSPNSRTMDGSESFLSIEILSSISDSMIIRVTFNDGMEIVNLSDDPVHYLGNAYDLKDSTAAVFYEKDGLIYMHSSNSIILQIETLNYIQGNLIYTYEDRLEYLEDKHCIHPLCEDIVEEVLSPHGYIESIHDFIPVPQALSLGDIDLDGLDEIITIEDGNIIAKNSNGILVNGFPIDGNFSGVPLIANILPSEYANDVGQPEIICREENDIIILSNRGARLRELSSLDKDQPLAMVPFWNGDTLALIDGSRLFLFDLDMDHSYWLNPNSRPSGLPLSTGIHFDPVNRELVRRKAYNYPNPILDGSTTFRFYRGSSTANKVQIHIYNAAGYLVDDLVNSKELIPYEFNEIHWDASQVDAGLYFAEIELDVGQSELVRLVVIK